MVWLGVNRSVVKHGSGATLQCTNKNWDPEQVGILEGDSLWWWCGAPPGPPSHVHRDWVLYSTDCMHVRRTP